MTSSTPRSWPRLESSGRLTSKGTQELESLVTTLAVAWTLRHFHLMRDRFGVVDLAKVAGAWDSREVVHVVVSTKALEQ